VTTDDPNIHWAFSLRRLTRSMTFLVKATTFLACSQWAISPISSNNQRTIFVLGFLFAWVVLIGAVKAPFHNQNNSLSNQDVSGMDAQFMATKVLFFLSCVREYCGQILLYLCHFTIITY